MAKDLDVLSIGNAIVDVFAQVDESFLNQHALPKGSVQVVDEIQTNQLYAHLPNKLRTPGGTSANSMTGVVSLGGRSAFVGHVSEDELGVVFAKSMEDVGVELSLTYSVYGPGTGRCLVMVTPDADRTMCSCLGVSDVISVHNIAPDFLTRSKIIYLESYLFNSLAAKQANEWAAQFGRDSGARIALNLSAPFCVEQFRLDLVPFIEQHVDILLSNEAEMMHLLGVQDLESNLEKARQLADTVVMTQGHKGAIVLTKDKTFKADRRFVDNLVDTTGAGDQFAAGFLYGKAQGWDIPTCAQIATLAASEVLKHLGARPQANLKELLRQGVHKTIQVREL